MLREPIRLIISPKFIVDGLPINKTVKTTLVLIYCFKNRPWKISLPDLNSRR